MAEIENISCKKKKAGVKRSLKLSTRVDLTPMVDLGFMLVTFFVFTTTMAQPTAMNLLLPDDKEGPTTELCESCALTLILADDNKIFYYSGMVDTAEIKQADYTPESLRDMLVQKKREVQKVRGSNAFQVIIKPTEGASIKNVVNMLDEVQISMLARYFLDEPNAEEMKKIGG